MAREISCDSCGKHLGLIRDAKLAKGISYRCASCSKNREANEVESFLKGFGRYKNSDRGRGYE